MFTRADKGNITVTMDTKDYIERMSSLLSDNDTYVPVDKNPIKKITDNLWTLLKR